MWEGLILFFAAFVHGLAGFAFALLSVPLLSLRHPFQEIVPLIALFGATMNAIMLWLLRKNFHLRAVAGLVVGAIPGIFLGARALGTFPEKPLRVLLFLVISTYCAWEVLSPRATRVRLSAAWGPLFGLAAGFLGGLLMAPGPPVVIYVSLLRIGKDELKSALQGAFLTMAFFMILAHGLYGLLTQETLRSYLLYLPVVLTGMALGQALYLRLGDRSYHRLVHLFLFLSALASFLKVF
ncbi:sulfite exporter TauE/SafE family protein [Thermosulfurimonas marina]|uniref:Probable membrane transporter protein n=1 Tax=Thermosulfurimonas marina TaxID=2047767 RepID=A0A6H1WT14_9BACT|nr:sulfite exporter TauE/SafE family protein [Thermosulfurimonas marina]QJA06365.1 sulfite exporter TauE/SafE family protein [Thermosulfurimonas marina]